MLSGEEGDPQKVAVTRAKEILNSEEREGRWSVKELASKVGLTESHFCRVFKKVEGVTVGEFRAMVQKKRTNQYSGSDPSTVIALGTGDMKSSSGFVPPMNAGQVSPNQLDMAGIEPDQNDFSDAAHPGSMPNRFVGMDFDIFDFNFDIGSLEGLTPEILSDPSSPDVTDDGLQFLDFDSHNLLR